MFRPCRWAIIRLFTELVVRLYTRRGEYLEDEISYYFIVLVGLYRLSALYICMYLSSEMHA